MSEPLDFIKADEIWQVSFVLSLGTGTSFVGAAAAINTRGNTYKLTDNRYGDYDL